MGAGDRLLVVVDPTAESQPAVNRAVWLASRFQASVELFVCDYDQALLNEAGIDTSAAQQAKRRVLDRDLRKLHALAESVASQGIEVSVSASWHHPIDEGIVCKAFASRPSLVIKDTHYHPLLKRSIFSNTDWNLIRACPVSLLLVKPRQIAEHPSIMAAVDPLHSHDKPAELDRTILKRAEDLRKRTDGTLGIFHAFDPAVAIAAASDTMLTPLTSPVKVVTEAQEARHRNALEDLLAESRLEDAQTYFRQGVPHELLVQYAARMDVDFVVMGAASRSAIKRVFVGSTAERVLDKLHCDVLVVKIPERAERHAREICAPDEAVSP